jgi:L-alanine-DL-glutamate epimerase-like enolase superfamily enzyme
VIHLATAAVNNALWDMFARARGKPLWKLIVDMTPVRDIHLALVYRNLLGDMHRKKL